MQKQNKRTRRNYSSKMKKGGNCGYNGAAPYADAVFGDSSTQHAATGNLIAMNNPFAISSVANNAAPVTGGKKKTYRKKGSMKGMFKKSMKNIKKLFSWKKK